MPQKGSTMPVNYEAEPIITINGQQLTNAQAMTVRVAITSFAADLVEEGLGDDETGREIAQGYWDRLKELHLLIFTKRKEKGI